MIFLLSWSSNHHLICMRLLLLFFAITASISSSAKETTPVEKILLVQVNEIGIITVNRDTVGSDLLARYIQERLFKSYLGTGKMHSRIKLQKTDGNVPDMVTEVIIKEIKDGQQRALTEVSLQKHNRSFGSLDKRKQDKLKKLFPVLFQESFI